MLSNYMLQNEASAYLVSKPWGREKWLSVNQKYCFKIICINAGQRTSLQYHNQKLETIYVVSGEGLLHLENNNLIEQHPIKNGDFWTTEPGKKHRVEAVTDLVLLEASTPEVDDVVRIQDDTNRPDGRIDHEHVP